MTFNAIFRPQRFRRQSRDTFLFKKNAVRGRRKELAPRLLTMTIHPVLGLRLLSAWCSRAETMTTDGAYSIDVGLRLLAVTINLMVGL